MAHNLDFLQQAAQSWSDNADAAAAAAGAESDAGPVPVGSELLFFGGGADQAAGAVALDPRRLSLQVWFKSRDKCKDGEGERGWST